MSTPKGVTGRLRPVGRSARSVSPQTRVAPGWWVRQHDPESSLYLPTPLAARNRLEVGWSLVSTLDGAGAAALDRRGVLQLPDASWVLDWWFNHDGTWERASSVGGVRQRRTDGLPVADTRVRVGPNELIVRHGAAPRTGPPGAAWVTIEIEVDGPDPIGLAIVATPWTLRDQGRIDHVQVENGLLTVDGRPALVAERLPRAVHVVEVADELVDELAVIDQPASAGEGSAREVAASTLVAQSPDGVAGAALIWPMAHRSTLRLGVPIGPSEPGVELDPDELTGLGDVDAVAKGWALHLAAEPTIELPDATLTAVARAALAQLLAASDGAWFTGADAHSAAIAAGAVARAGHGTLARGVVGEVARLTDDDPAGLTAVLEACVGLGITMSADEVADAPEDLLVHLARALHVCRRRLRRYGVGWWPAAGRDELRRLVAVATVLADGWDQDGVADNARAVAELLVEGAKTEPVAPVIAEAVDPERSSVGAARADDGATVDGVSDPGDQELQSGLTTEVRWVRRTPGADLDLPATLAAARADIACGDPAGAVTVAAVASLLNRLECWPDAVHPIRPLGVGEDGASVATMAHLLAATFELSAPIQADGLVVFPAFPPEWWGKPAQFSAMAVLGGSASCALRWHGARPALIWELRPDAGRGASKRSEGRRLSAPALDPAFAAEDLDGEALLAMPPGAAEFLTARAEAAQAAEAAAETSGTGTPQEAGSSTDDRGASAGEPQTGDGRAGGGVTMNVGIPTRRRSDGA